LLCGTWLWEPFGIRDLSYPKGFFFGTALVARKILVPIDFSEISLQAFAYAKRIAEASGAILYLVHTIKFPRRIENYYTHYSEIGQWVRVYMKKQAQGFFQKMIEGEGSLKTAVRYKILEGDLAEQVLNLVESEGIDFIILGITPLGGPLARFKKNHLYTILEKASCPVITINSRVSCL
jgi:nucleotide-binding universal stress UspA family protein